MGGRRKRSSEILSSGKKKKKKERSFKHVDENFKKHEGRKKKGE